MSHQNKQRDHRQVITGEARKCLVVEEIRKGEPTRLRNVSVGARNKHRDSNRNAHGHEDQHDAENNAHHLNAGHAASPN